MPTFYDDAQDPDIPPGYYTMRTYTLLDHSVNAIPGYVSLHIPAGVYTATAFARAPLQAQSPTTGTSYSGTAVWAALNDLGGNIWYKVGMPNEKVEDNHFSILYNTRAGVTADKALVAHEGLSMAHTYFRTRGYEVPDWVIVTLDPNLDAEGVTSGLGRLGHWNMSLAAWQVDEDLRSAAAHELFHVIQYENMSIEARALKWNWTWWMEGTAVWAETVAFPDSNTAAYWVQKGADFIAVGLDNYNSLSENQAYATVALVSYLEQEQPGTVLEVLQALGPLIGPQDALKIALDIGAFYEGFAKTYLHPEAEPFQSWDVSKAFATVTVTTPSAEFFGKSAPALSALGVKVIASTGPTAPISFSEADGSVVRVPGNNDSVTFGWNPDGSAMPAIYGMYPEAGHTVARAVTFVPAAPLQLLYVNTSVDTQVSSPQVRLEVPTLTLVTPSSFDRSQPQTFQLQGGGFGTIAGQVWIGMAAYTADSWNDTTISVTLPANSVGAGVIIVRVEHAAGVRSNLMLVTAN